MSVETRQRKDKGYKGMGMEGWIARWYAKTTRKALPDFQALARRVHDATKPGGRILEVAPGPGYFAIELARLGDRHVTGLDVSHTFVEIGRCNAIEGHVDVEFRQGNVAEMPFENESFDFLVCRAAFKNFSQPVQALREMHRVLAPGGRALIIDLRRDTPQAEINRHIDGMGVGFANAVFMKLTFRFMLLKRAYTQAVFRQLAEQTPFQSIDIQTDAIGMEIALGK